ESWCDTTTDVGRLMLTIMGGVAEFERGLIRKRTDEGIERAKRQGKKFGRPERLDAGQKTVNADAYGKGATIPELAEEYGVGVARIWRALENQACSRHSGSTIGRLVPSRCREHSAPANFPYWLGLRLAWSPTAAREWTSRDRRFGPKAIISA